MLVENATKSDYHPDSFWYYPWGKSITHKGVDIFAEKGTHVLSSVSGLVIYKGKVKYGVNIILILGPKWHLHYYAHLKDIKTTKLSWVNREDVIGSVGISGNAINTPPHLHYSIKTLIPYFWRIDNSPQGCEKCFILTP